MELSDQQYQACRALAKTYGLVLLYLFGSTTRGDRHAQSDIDIAYQAVQPLSAQQRFQLAVELKGIINLPAADVDLVDIHNAPPLLRYLILQDGIQLAGSDAADDNFYCTTMKRYIDTQPLRQLTQQYVHAQIGL